MKNHQKGFAKIWLVLGLIIVIVIGFFVIVKNTCWLGQTEFMNFDQFNLNCITFEKYGAFGSI